MAERTETREISIKICDFCGLELHLAHRCAVCKREMCARGETTGNGHAAYAILRLSKMRERPGDDDDDITHLRVRKECAKTTISLPVGELLDGLMKEGFSFKPFMVRKGH